MCLFQLENLSKKKEKLIIIMVSIKSNLEIIVSFFLSKMFDQNPRFPKKNDISFNKLVIFGKIRIEFSTNFN